MSDRSLFAVGLVFGPLALAFGFFAPGVLLALSIISGVWDARRHPQLRWVRSWSPALLGSLVFPAIVVWISATQLRDPPGSDGGPPIVAVQLAFLAAYAVAFAAVTLGVSAVARRLQRPRNRDTASEQFAERDGA